MMMLSSQSEPHVGLAGGSLRGAHVGGLGQEQPQIVVARWTDTRTEDRRDAVVAMDGQSVLGVALTPLRIRLSSGREMIFDGVMASGMTYICRPSQTLQAEFSGPADLLHLYVADDLIDHDEASPATMLSRDALIEHLARAVQAVEDGADEGYIETLGRAIVARAAQIRERSIRVSPLPKWRLRRVIDHIDVHISQAISLADLAAAAGLSRTHFTAQFRLATGCRPHDFILLQRIESAKRLLLESPNGLVDIALAVGFQAQAHFSTVFKRFVGEPPGRWRRKQLAERPQRQGETCLRRCG